MDRGVTGSIAAWVEQLDYTDIPPAVREAAAMQRASVLGAVLAGARSEVAVRVREAAVDWGSGEDSTVFPGGPRAPLHSACYANAVASVAFDFDDYLVAGHTGHSAVLAPLAFGEMLGASGRDVVTAQVAANEVAGRLGAAFLLGPHNGQMWTYIHAIAGAVVAGRFLKLDAGRLADAIGIALAQPPYPLAPAFFGPDSKATLASGPLVEGIRAAQLAARGLTGAPDPISGAGGMLERIATRGLPFAFEALGSAWVTQSLAFKIYPGCAYIDTPVDAACVIRDEFARAKGRSLTPADVDSVRVEATLFTDGMEQMSAPHRTDSELRAADVNFSVGLSLGVLIACGEISVETLSTTSLAQNQDEIRAVAQRVHVEQSMEMNGALGGLNEIGIDMLRLFDPAYQPTLEGVDFGKFRMRFPSRVTLKTASRDEFVAEVATPRGAPGRPVEETRALVAEKFLAGARPVLRDPDAALETVLGLDDASNVRTAVESFRTP
ncbi:MAG: MmgE/PrpD family protein [Actinomycetota bacterium]